MCDRCEERVEAAGRAAGVPIVTVMHDKVNNVLSYALFLGEASVMVELPIGDGLQNAADCAAYVGAHLREAITAATEAFLEQTAEGRAALAVSELEKMLRDQ